MTSNKILAGELVLIFLASEIQWRRVLSMHEGTYIEMDLTPRNFPKASQSQWELTAAKHFRMHSRARGPGDKQYRCVVDSSVIRQGVVYHMMRGGMLEEDIYELLSHDFLPELDMKELKTRFNGFYNQVRRHDAHSSLSSNHERSV